MNVNKTTKGYQSLTGHWTLPICINGQHIEGVEPIVYLGSFVSASSGMQLDVAIRDATVSTPRSRSPASLFSQISYMGVEYG